MNEQEILSKLSLERPGAECIAYLDQLSLTPSKEKALAVSSLLKHPDYLTRCKAYGVLRKIFDPVILPKLYTILQTEQSEEFRLHTLELIQLIGEESSVLTLGSLLSDFNPFVVRGSIVALGGIGGREAVRTILEFASKPQGRIIRREVVAEALGYALQKVQDPEEFLAALQQENKRVKHYLQDLELKAPPIPHFTVYPSADYFSLQAKSRGIDYKKFKRMIK
ncbi:HEAT repeat domain-containing protein [Bacillota bacterium LX-D]|nr:HEAT repeat domain-containing protein [Bacillota bacterium LX-D]